MVLFFLVAGFCGLGVSLRRSRMLYDVFLVNFVVITIKQLPWVCLKNAPMPQPLSVFSCVSEGKIILKTQLSEKR